MRCKACGNTFDPHVEEVWHKCPEVDCPEITTRPDGLRFPVYEGKTLSWSIGLYFTIAEERLGYPRMRTVIRAMAQERPQQLKREHFEALKASFGHNLFCGNAKRELAIIEEEVGRYEPTPLGG